MTTKTLYVSSAVQAALMSQVFIPELIDGFWKNHRPAGHGDVWRDVKVEVSTNGTLGPVGFDAPRNYNFLNLDFAIPNQTRLVEVAQSVKANSNFKSVKKELIELGRIVGSRLPTRDSVAVKLYRGNHKDGTVTVSSSKARQAAAQMVSAGELAATVTPPKSTVKKTVTKIKTPDSNVITTKTAAGATVRRVPLATEVPVESHE